MLINVYATRPTILPGTRQLETLEVEGTQLRDLYNTERRWWVGPSYLPLGRSLGGVRVKLTDQKGFITFCNQRDMEVLLGQGQPGAWCRWANETYAAPGDERWVGLCCDEADLQDEIHRNEEELRECSPYHPWLLPPGVLPAPRWDIELRVHVEPGYDVEERHVMHRDYDITTGFGPDNRLETVHQRWARSERRRVQWSRE